MTWGKRHHIGLLGRRLSQNGQHLNDKFALDGEIHPQLQGFIGAMVCSIELSSTLTGHGRGTKTGVGNTQSRLDMDAYERHVTRLAYKQERPFIIVGAGLLEHVQHRFSPTTATTSSFSIKEPFGGRHQRSGRESGAYNHGWMPSVEKSTPTCPSTKCSRGPMFVAILITSIQPHPEYVL